jgi:PAS domain S-box-containing protein
MDNALSAGEAIEKLKEEKYDAIISDYQMPEKDGLDFLKELRSKGDNIPFIIFTGKGREEVATKALNLGADQYIDKNGDPETVYCELAHGVHHAVERKRAEEQLRVSEKKYRELFETSRDGLVYTDMNGLILDCNQAYADMLGYSKEELRNLTYQQLTSEKWHKMETEIVQQRIMKKDYSDEYEKEYIRKDGTAFPISITAWLITDEEGQPRGMWGIVRDISERKKAENLLRTCTDNYEKLFESTREGLLISGLDGKISSANPAAAKILRYPGPKELVGLVAADLYVDPQRKGALLEQLMKNGYVDKFEIELRRNDGTQVCVQTNVSVQKDAEGNILRTETLFREASKQEQTEEELADLKERLNVLFLYAPDAYYLNDLKGTFIDGNKAAERITGYSKTELIGKSFLKLSLLPRSQIPKAAKLLAMNALGKPTGPDELILHRKDGTKVPVEIRTYPAKIKGKTVVLGIARDITERKEAERTVLESQQKFKGLFTGNPEATVYLDRDFHILDINPRFTSLFGYSLQEVRGKRLNDVVVPKNQIEEAETLDKKAIEGYVYHDTVRMQKDGSLIPVSISAAPIFIQGQLAGYIGVYKDISELKKTEKDLQTTMKRLETMNEKLRVVGGLTRHDARNKLAVITGNAYLAKKELADNSKILDYLKEMETSVQQVVRIFDFAKAYEMLGVEQMLYVDVEKTVNEAISLFSGMKDTKVINDCHGLTVLADSLLRQLFYNLVDNSLKYGKKITKIKVHYERTSQDELKLIYEDDGIGIPAAEKSKLFKEGYSTGGSTGHGLYLIKKIMEAYGWAIQETGEPGQGARFVMTIPKANQSGKEKYRIA